MTFSPIRQAGILAVTIFTATLSANAQGIGIGTATPAASAMLDVQSTTRGLLIPRMTTAQRNSILNPAVGLMIFDTNRNSFWLYQATGWQELANVSQSATLLSRNGGSAFDTLATDRKRYIWEVGPAIPFGTSISIPTQILLQLCQDIDGCRITLTMSDWDATVVNSGISTSASGVLYIGFQNNGRRRWRFSRENGLQSVEGTDGDGSVHHVVQLFETAYFSDGAFTDNTGSDAALGFHLLRWAGGGYASSVVVRLIVED
jgi:hypothetical protein